MEVGLHKNSLIIEIKYNETKNITLTVFKRESTETEREIKPKKDKLRTTQLLSTFWPMPSPSPSRDQQLPAYTGHDIIPVQASCP